MEICCGAVVPVWAQHPEIDCTIPLTNNWRSAFEDAAGRITSDHEFQKRDTGSGSGEGWTTMIFYFKKNLVWSGLGANLGGTKLGGTYPKPH